MTIMQAARRLNVCVCEEERESETVKEPWLHYKSAEGAGIMREKEAE